MTWALAGMVMGRREGRRVMPVQGPERTPFSDAGTAIPAERAGVTYRIN